MKPLNLYYQNDRIYITSEHTHDQELAAWANDKIHSFILMARGCGWSAIDARHKLDHMRSLSLEELLTIAKENKEVEKKK